MRKWFLLAAAAAMVASLPGAASAQQPKIERQDRPKVMPQPPAKTPPARGPRTQNLDFLLGALKAAPDEESAKAVEARIWALWTATPSDTAALLMTRARAAMESKDYAVALKLLDAIVKLRPDYVEGWNRRATLYYQRNDYERSLRDIQQVLAREPRHFGALTGLGMIMQELGEDRRALEAFRKAIEVNPHLDQVPAMIKTLTEKVEGRDI